MTVSTISSLSRGHSSCREMLRTCAAAIVVGLLLSTSAAQAQMTSEMLIGDSVSNIGSRYSDVDEAIKRFGNRDVLGARQFMEAAKRKDPKLPPVDLLMAKMYFLSGNPAAGLVLLEKTVLENPSEPEPYILLADRALADRNTIAAESLYQKAMTLVDEFEENLKRKRQFVISTHAGLGAVDERRSNWASAAAHLAIVVQNDPDNATAHYRLGRALFMSGKSSEGYEEFKKAKALDENMPDAFVATALLYEELGERDQAEKAFERAVKENKDNLVTLNAYAQWLIQKGDLAKAEAVLAAARKIDEESLDTLVLSGVAARIGSKMKPAEGYFLQALGLQPGSGAVINQLALLLIDQPDEKKQKRALDFARINAKLNSENGEANISYAWVAYRSGLNTEANAALRKGLQLGNLNADSNYLIAQMLFDQGQVEPARQFVDNALDKSDGGIFINRTDAEALRDKM